MGGLLPNGTLGIYRQSLSLAAGREGAIEAFRGISIIYNNVSNGNAVISINGQSGTSHGITVISNTSGSISFDNSGNYLLISNEELGKIKMRNVSQASITVCLLSFVY